MQKIFVSHSSKDAKLVDALVNILLDNGCQIERNDIYCSSLEGMKTLPGDPDWIRDLKDKMEATKLIILLLSPNYYDSQYCLAELGATWLLNIATFPIVVPPLEVGGIKGILQVAQVGSVKNELHLDRLRDAALEACGVPHRNTDNWSRQRVKFLDQLDSILKELPQPQHISPDDLKHAQERAEVYKQERDEAQSDINRLKGYITQIEQLKDKVEVGKLKFENLPDTEQFVELTNRVVEKLRKLPPVVAWGMFDIYFGKPIFIDREEETVDAEYAARDGYLEKDHDGKFYAKWSMRVMKETKESVSDLEIFLSGRSSEFREAFEDENDYEPKLDLKPLWDRYIFSDLKYFGSG